MTSVFTFRLGSFAACAMLLAGCGESASPAPPSNPSTFTVGGTLTGLATGASVVLQNNAGDNLAVNANGTFQFTSPVTSGGAYAVTVLTQPANPTQRCAVTNGRGTASAIVSRVTVNCVTSTFSVSGTVTGLVGSIVLQNNGGSNRTVTTNGSFSFPAQASGTTYAVTVLSHPTGPNQLCTPTNSTGTIGAAAVTNVVIACATTVQPIGGTVSGLAGTGLVLRDSVSGQTRNVTANGAYTFTTSLSSGAAYAVTVQTQPASPTQACVAANGTGTVGAGPITNINVTCSTNSNTIGGTISGLAAGATVVLRNNGGNDLTRTVNGPFVFTTPITSGLAYLVTVFTQPTVPGPGQTCTVTSGSGTVASANVTNVSVACSNIDQAAPTVTTRSPLPTAVGAKVQGGVVTVTFSEAVNPATVTNSSFTLQGPSGAISGQISFATGNTQAIFTPGLIASPTTLAFDEFHTVTLTTAITDASSNPLAANVTWSFNTGKKLAAGSLHTCARFPDGRVKCWGNNDYGQLGYDDLQHRGDGAGPGTSTLAAVNLGTGRTAVALAAGDNFTCALLDNGDAKCWGSNTQGALGQGALYQAGNSVYGDSPGEMAALPAINVGAGRTVIEIAPGQEFTCARLDNNAVKCWGLNTSGQLGQGNTTNRGVVANDIAGLPAISFGAGLTPIALTSAYYHACATLVDASGNNHVKCWGDNRWGQLGQGNTTPLGDGPIEMGDTLPEINFGTGLTAQYVMANGGHTCAKLSNLATKCWGLNTWGQVGLNAGNSNPLLANRLVCTAGPRDCVGDLSGEMGDSLTPAIAAGNTARLTVANRHNCVLQINGQTKCWGSNEEGQLGLGTNAGNNAIIGDQAGEMAALATTPLKSGAVVEELTSGGFHSCVWNTVDTINCWGDNRDGQLGRNDSFTWGDSGSEMGDNLLDVNLGL